MDYKSRSTLLGLPLIHVASTRIVNGRHQRGIARGWIAIGDISFGILFSVGGIACGGVAIGGVALGVVGLGGLGLGLICLGGLALGGHAVGGLAVGIVAVGGGAIALYDAEGGLAVAGHAARGGLAIAHEYAVGGDARAAHANDGAAQQYFETSPVRFRSAVVRWAYQWVCWLGFAVMMGLLVFWSKLAGKPPPVDDGPS